MVGIILGTLAFFMIGCVFFRSLLCIPFYNKVLSNIFWTKCTYSCYFIHIKIKT